MGLTVTKARSARRLGSSSQLGKLRDRQRHRAHPRVPADPGQAESPADSGGAGAPGRLPRC